MKKYMASALSMYHGKISDFVSFPLFGFPLVLQLRNFDLESHWNTLTFFDEKIYDVDLNMSRGRMSDFLSFPLLGFTLVIKLGNFDFQSHWNTLMFFYQKNDVRFKYVLSNSV